MKRSLLTLLMVAIVAGWVGTLIARDAGYVLISYNGATLQTGLWVMLAIVVVTGLLIYSLLKFAIGLRGASGRFKNWGSERRRIKAAQLTTRGLIYLQEGEFERAEKFLISGATNHESPVINYIGAAKAAEARGDSEQREAYLRQALATEDSAKQAVAIASAEMAMGRDDWQSCIKHLREVKDNLSTLILKREAFLHLEDWQALQKLIPQLRKQRNGASVDQLEKQVVLKLIEKVDASDQELSASFKNSSESIRQDETVILEFCRAISNEKEAETTLRKALKNSWSDKMVEAYGSLGDETLKQRLKTAEGWLKNHEDSASLQLCLGRLYEASGEREKAKQLYESSVEGGNLTGASHALANLLAFDGDFEKSNEYLRLALEK